LIHKNKFHAACKKHSNNSQYSFLNNFSCLNIGYKSVKVQLQQTPYPCFLSKA